ncbi:MAG: cytochrome [Sphingomonas bacterium]|jgi:cytochrome c|nr:cytochrome [Sphingomonas bacterium]
MPSRYGRLTLALAVSALAIAACSKKAEETAATPTATAPATPADSGAPAADNVDTVDGSKLASFTGDAAKGEATFVQCKICHQLDRNGIGPQLHGVVGRKAGTVPAFNYSDTDKNSGITWTPEKLFQFLEKPQRVMPGTRMTFAGVSDAQTRADIIAYLKAN